MSVSLPRMGCANPFNSQPTAAAMEMVATDAENSSCQVETKTPYPWRRPTEMKAAKKRAHATYQP
jgi:hypothetical protein